MNPSAAGGKISMTAVVLAGGKSSRMGQDKAFLKFGDKTILEFLVHLLTALFSETLVVVDNKTRLEGLALSPAEVCEDLIKARGPLAGVYTALVHSRTRASCILTCDMPFVDEMAIRELISFQQEEWDAICLEDPEGRLNPFPGIYMRSCRILIRTLLDQDASCSMQRFLEVAAVKPLVVTRERIRVLTNMNTIEDYYSVLKEKKKKEKVRE
jgi:molybdopterin-guanine dinucleotide biosynthesis protein A